MRKYVVSVAVFLFLFMNTGSASAEIYSDSPTVTFSGGQRTVNLVRADLNDPSIKVEAAIAQNQIGRADDLKNIAEQLATANKEVIAAINGTYFSAYNGYPVPWNTIQKQGEFIHIGNIGSVIGFSDSNQARIESMYISIKGSTNGKWTWPNDWYAWGFNHMREEPEAVVIFTLAYGTTTGPHDKVSVVVRNGVITDIHTGEAMIPADGFTIVVGDRSIMNRFKVGNRIAYRVDTSCLQPYTQQAGARLDWSNMKTTIGAGPTVLKNGVVTADAEAEGFWESKIVTDRYQRSFAGITAANTLIIGTVSNVTVRELGEIAQKLNCLDAMALDSGASSSLYYRGRYLTTPGRQLSNALVITKVKSPPIKLMVNRKELQCDTDPFIKDGRTMVPMRIIFEQLGIIPMYNPVDRTITASKGSTNLKLQINNNIAWVNGNANQLEVPAMLYNNRTYVPVRFITELFNGSVEWDAAKNMVVLTI